MRRAVRIIHAVRSQVKYSVNNTSTSAPIKLRGSDKAIYTGDSVALQTLRNQTDPVIVDSWDKVAYPALSYEKFWDGIKKAAEGVALTCELRFRI